MEKNNCGLLKVSHIKLQERGGQATSGPSPSMTTTSTPSIGMNGNGGGGDLEMSSVPGGSTASGTSSMRRSRHLTRSAETSGRDLSWDEVSQTSSTSGYRESYSQLMMTLESPPSTGQPMGQVYISPQQTLVLAGSSPESGGSLQRDESTLLGRRTSNSHPEDEDTLI